MPDVAVPAPDTERAPSRPVRRLARTGLALSLILMTAPLRWRLRALAPLRVLPAASPALVGAVSAAVPQIRPAWYRGRIACMENSLATVLALALCGRRAHWVLGAGSCPPRHMRGYGPRTAHSGCPAATAPTPAAPGPAPSPSNDIVMPSTGGDSHARPGGQRPHFRTAKNITGRAQGFRGFSSRSRLHHGRGRSAGRVPWCAGRRPCRRGIPRGPSTRSRRASP